jgi:tetratricopeptide (TPR) repeat protein
MGIALWMGTAFLFALPTSSQFAGRQARTLFGLGVLRLHEDRLVEAAHLFQQAARLDPEAAPIWNRLVPLYLALGRDDEALAACRTSLTLDPDDYRTWHSYAKQLRNRGRFEEASLALRKGLACPNEEHPEDRLQMTIDLGLVLEQDKRYAPAVAAFEAALRILQKPEPLLNTGALREDDIKAQSAALYYRVIQLSLTGGNVARARAAFEKAARDCPEIARRSDLYLARISLAAGRPKEALDRLNAYITAGHGSPDAFELRIEAQRSAGWTPADIALDLAAWTARQPEDWELRLLCACQLGEAGRWTDAEAEYKKALERAPSAANYHSLFQLYKKRNLAQAPSDVLKLLEETMARAKSDGLTAPQPRALFLAIRQDRKLTKSLLPLACRSSSSLTWLALAKLATSAGELEPAEALYRKCLEVESKEFVRQHLLYEETLEVLWRERKYAEVAALAQQGLQQARPPEQALFHYFLALAFAKQGMTEEALSHADQAVVTANARTRFAQRLNRLRVLTLVNHHAQAVAEAEAMLEQYHGPKQVRDIRRQLSRTYSAMGKLDRAEEQLRAILELDPNDAAANHDLGQLWSRQKKHTVQAEDLIRKAKKLGLSSADLGHP